MVKLFLIIRNNLKEYRCFEECYKTRPKEFIRRRICVRDFTESIRLPAKGA